MKNNPANFKLRLLATSIDFFLWSFIILLSFYFILQQPSIAQAFYLFIVSCVFIFLNPLILFYSIPFIYYWRTTPGKFLTGLEVTDDDGKNLTFKRTFFRQIVGYQFSALVLGLGYLNIITDPEKKAWHDKAVGSKVFVKQNIWPMAIIILAAIIYSNFFFADKNIRILKSDTSLTSEAKQFWSDYRESIKPD